MVMRELAVSATCRNNDRRSPWGIPVNSDSAIKRGFREALEGLEESEVNQVKGRGGYTIRRKSKSRASECKRLVMSCG